MIQIRKDIYEQMIEEAKQAFPCECCGVLAGKESSATKIYSVKNVDPDPETCFLMDSRTQFKVFKTIDKIYIDMVAIYHSHPNSECYPSARDIKMNSYPDVAQIIISLDDIDTPEVKAFIVKDGKVVEEEIKFI